MSPAPTSCRGDCSDVNGNWPTQVVHAAAELRLADLLADGPSPARARRWELRRQSTVSAPAAADARVTRHMHAGGRRPVRLTPMGELLRTGVEGRCDHGRCTGAARCGRCSGKLSETVRTGDEWAGTPLRRRRLRRARARPGGGRRLQPGDGGADVAHDPGHRRRLRRGRGQPIVDVGGGYGHVLAALLEVNPTCSGVLFDRPHAIESAPAIDRCEKATGDFFTAVPDGGDVYLLKSILHDWPDEQAAGSSRPYGRR